MTRREGRFGRWPRWCLVVAVLVVIFLVCATGIAIAEAVSDLLYALLVVLVLSVGG